MTTNPPAITDALVGDLSAILRHKRECVTCRDKPLREWPAVCQVWYADTVQRTIRELGGSSLWLHDQQTAVRANGY